jgi:hypothetical protein
MLSPNATAIFKNDNYIKIFARKSDSRGCSLMQSCGALCIKEQPSAAS